MISQRFKRHSKWRTNSPAYQFCSLSNNSKKQLGAPIKTWQQYSMHGNMVGLIEIHSSLRRKKLHRMNQGSNFLGGSFSKKDNVRGPIQFRRACQPQHLKKWFFFKNKPNHFHINSTSVIRPVKQNQFSFAVLEINKSVPAPVHNVS